MTIPNKYEDILDSLIDSSDIESLDLLHFPDRFELIDKGPHQELKSRDGLSTLLEEDCLDGNILVISLELASMIQDLQIYQCHDIAPLSPKNKKV